MEITYTQNQVINSRFAGYDRDKSSIIFEAGGVTVGDDGKFRFIGSFIASIHGKGKYRFGCKFVRTNGIESYEVTHKKIK